MEGLLNRAAQETVLHAQFGWLVRLLDWAAAGIDLAAILLLLIGAGRFIAGVVAAETKPGEMRVRRTNRERVALGQYILAGLELLIVSDVIHTALSLAFADLVFLLLLVIIRSIVSFFLDSEPEQLKQELGS